MDNMNNIESNTWVVAKNGDILMRFNKLPDEALTEFPFRMGIAIPVTITVETNVEMQKIEDMIESLIGANGALVAVVTSPDFKEFVLYVKEGLDYKKIHEDIKSSSPNYDIQMYVEKDPNRTFFKDTKASIKQ